eukprot:1815236-Amphidinium_carterae.1
MLLAEPVWVSCLPCVGRPGWEDGLTQKRCAAYVRGESLQAALKNRFCRFSECAPPCSAPNPRRLDK